MLKSCLVLLAASASLVFAAPIAAQEAEIPVGPPELRDFELPGTTTTPAPAEGPAQAPAPTPAEAQPEPTAPPAADVDAPEAELTAPAEPRPEPQRRSPSQTLREPQPEAPPPVAEIEAPTAAAPGPDIAPQTTERTPEPGSNIWLLYLLAGILAAGTAAGFLLKRRRPREELIAAPAPRAGTSPEPLEDLATARTVSPASRPTPAPAPARPTAAPETLRVAAAAGDTVGISLRPRLELEFRPEKAAATDSGATLHYELIVRNSGRSAARNVRVEARMFNAGAEQDREIGAFFTSPLSDKLVARPFSIPPESRARLERVVAMPRDEVREFEIQGRRLFIPMVAFNVLYEWGEGQSGQTSMSYVVGRETETPSEKMGAFRFDLGPRVYRSVGQRPAALARIA